jgi:hypothetical protein
MLCLAIGIVHPDVLDELVNDKQINEWIAYYKINPFGHSVDTEMRAGIAAAIGGGSIQDRLPNVREVQSEPTITDVESMPMYGAVEQYLIQLQQQKRGVENDGCTLRDNGSTTDSEHASQ